MSQKVSDIRDKRTQNDDSVLESLFQASLEISAERDETEREIKRLAELGKRDEAWTLVVKHFDIKEPVRLRRVK